MEMSVANNSQIKLQMNILNKVKECKTDITIQEKENLIEFLCTIPIFKDNIRDIKTGGVEFTKIWEGLNLRQCQRGSIIYQKKSFIDGVYFLISGEIVKIDEKHLDLDEILDVEIK